MSFVEVLPVEPVIPTTRAFERERTCAGDRSEGEDRVGRHEHSARSARDRVLDEIGTVADRNEQVALLDPPRVDLHAGDDVGPWSGDHPPERFEHVQLERDHPQHLASDRAIVEGHILGGELHFGVRAFAGDHDDVSRRRVGQRRLDRRAAVEDDLERSVCDLPRDLRGLLGSRVVGRDDRAVSELAGDSPHKRSLLAVAVAAGPEDDREAPTQLACGRQHVLQRVGGVGVVDNHRERLTGVDRLEAAGHAGKRLDAGANRALLDPELAGGPDRTQRVRTVEPPAQLQRETLEIVVGGERARAREVPCQLLPPGIPDVDDGMLRLVEQRPLRSEVLLHRPVEIEVVLCQIREDEHREPSLVKPALRGGDRRGLHRARAVSGLEHRTEEPLQVDRLGGIQPRRERYTADPPLDVRQQCRLAAGSIEDRVEEERRRRLPVRAGRGDNLELP